MIRYPRPAELRDVPAARHAVIEASAGTGKTYIIEHLVVDLLISAACRLEEILVVTFTDPATVELRDKIRRRIQTIATLRETPAGTDEANSWIIDGAVRARLDEALRAFDRASIQTIHGFCRRVLGELAFETRMRFGLDLADGRAVFRQAFRAVLREDLTREEIRPLVDAWLQEPIEWSSPSDGPSTQIDGLEDLLYKARQHRYLEGGTAIRDGESDPVVALIAAFDAPGLRNEYGAASINAAALEAALVSIDALESLIQDTGGAGARLRERLASFDFEPIANPSRKHAPRKGKNPFPGGLSEEAGAFLDRVRDLRGAVTLEQRIVAAFLPRVEARLEQRKRAEGILDYDDMLRWLRRALLDPGGEQLAAILRARYRQVLIDEFQDTDDVQWDVFRRVFLEGVGGARVRVVGDPKQAIYAFRGADVHAYLRAREELGAAGPPGAVRVTLRRNFRSSARLIKGLNQILLQNATPPIFTGEIRYEHPVSAGLPALRARDDAGGEPAPIVLMRYAPAENGASKPSLRRAMASRIASRIAEMLRPGAGLRIENHPQRADPRVLARDIFVLTRSNDDLAEIGRWLRLAGVPFVLYKQEGLFQEKEALDVLDLLRALHQPGNRSRRLRVWASPFFRVPWREIESADEAPPPNRLHDLLLSWRELAERRDFATLFNRVLHESGLVHRELLLARSERSLTNYLHVLEVLLEEAVRKRLGMPELIALLEGYIAETAKPVGIDGNVQRLESERDAVRLMTIHGSKGLEADVVFLYGGVSDPRRKPRVSVYHDGHARRVVVGDLARELVKEVLEREQREEDERLMYVAITRARAVLYLPCIPEGVMGPRSKVGGSYKILNDRLQALVGERDGDAALQALIRVEDVPDAAPRRAAPRSGAEDPIAAWRPEARLTAGGPPAIDFDGIARSPLHRPLVLHSYTSLHGRQAVRDFLEPADLREDADDAAAEETPGDLPPGREVGLFLHQAIEDLDFATLRAAPDQEAWKAMPEVRGIFQAALRRHGLDSRVLDPGMALVHAALTARVSLDGGAVVEGLHASENRREVAFTYPIPEASQALLGSDLRGAWRADRGFLHGSVDIVFRHDGRLYFGDWKSDHLADYGRDALGARVRKVYALQAQIYAIGILRWLAVRDEADYDARFGGFLYLFLRGMGEGNGRGVHFERPGWEEIRAWERSLMNVPGLPEVRE